MSLLRLGATLWLGGVNAAALTDSVILQRRQLGQTPRVPGPVPDRLVMMTDWLTPDDRGAGQNRSFSRSIKLSFRLAVRQLFSFLLMVSTSSQTVRKQWTQSYNSWTEPSFVLITVKHRSSQKKVCIQKRCSFKLWGSKNIFCAINITAFFFYEAHTFILSHLHCSYWLRMCRMSIVLLIAFT